MRRLLPASIAAAAALLALAGCSAGGGAPAASASGAASAAPSGAITVYNAQHQELTQAWADAFTAKTGVQVTLRNGDDSGLANQLVQEGSASPADVFLTENSPGMTLVDNAGLLASVDPATLAATSASYHAGTGTWTGIAARSTVLVYNPSMIAAADLPASIMDLQNAAYKGKWGAAPGGADFQAIVSAILAQKGTAATTAWLAAMKQNATIYPSNTAAMAAVNSGQVPMAVIYHYYWYIDQSTGKANSGNTQLKYFGNQDPGAFVSVSGGGVLASSKNPVAAQAFLAFITGTAGQDILRTGTSFEYAVGTGDASNPALPALTGLGAPTIDPATLNGREVTTLMTQAGLI